MSKTIGYVLGFFLLIAILASGGLGVWGYQLNAKLTTTQKQLASVQGDLDKARADNAQLSANLEQSNSSLGQTKADLVKAQSDLKAAESDKSMQQAKLDRVKKYLLVTDAIWVNGENDNSIKAKVKATGDSQLISLFATVMQTPNISNGQAFDEFLFGAIDTAVN